MGKESSTDIIHTRISKNAARKTMKAVQLYANTLSGQEIQTEVIRVNFKVYTRTLKVNKAINESICS